MKSLDRRMINKSQLDFCTSVANTPQNRKRKHVHINIIEPKYLITNLRKRCVRPLQ